MSAVKPMIPSMGGRELGPVFNRYIETMDYGLDVVEVGAWLGAGTYELATALVEHGHDQTTLHVYDRFEADKGQVTKAAGAHRYPANIRVGVSGKGDAVKLTNKQDTLPVVKRNLKGFPFIRYHKGEIGRLAYRGRKIGVLVVDAVKRDPHFTALMNKLELSLAPGAVVFFMDYWYHRKALNVGTECQGKYIKRSGRYEHLEDVSGLSCAVFRFKGKRHGG